ncbi:MAG: agmatine deiminase family protein [Candidatus Hydrogenedentes bacterium]|nr:agmatine deiminase family protein [Candidatus Hydrogenedentota bacterium]
MPMRVAQYRLPLFVGLVVIAVIGVAVRISGIHPTRAPEALEESPAVTEMALFYEPTEPIPVTQPISESAPVLALVVAMPEAQVLGNAGKTEFLLQIIEIASKYTRVVVLVNRDEPGAIQRIRELLEQRANEPAAVLERLRFQSTVIDTEWVRDYGPLFALGVDGKLVLLDNMYRDIRSEAATDRMLADIGFTKTGDQLGGLRADANIGGGHETYLSDYGYFWRYNDDAAPLYFNEVLYIQRGQYASLVRSPLQLSGGDVTFTTSRDMFTSTRTLELNGGDEKRFSRLANEYFGAEEVHYLRPLPRGMWHIDMFFKIAGPKTFMIGTFTNGMPSGNGPLDVLTREANEVLEWNRAYIQERFPEVQVVTVPMPPIVQARIHTQTNLGKTGIGDLDDAIKTAGARLKPASSVLYRSYLNSVFINGGSSPSAVLVPRFSGLEEEERQAETAYRQAFVGADIHFVDADAMVQEFGGIHCVTVTIPDTNAG